MTLVVSVQGGTNAGHKPAMQPTPQPWTCSNGHANPGYARGCLNGPCLERRPR